MHTVKRAREYVQSPYLGRANSRCEHRNLMPFGGKSTSQKVR